MINNAMGENESAAICSDKTFVGKGVDYCLTDSETVCDKCTDIQICCSWNLKDEPDAPSNAAGKMAVCGRKNEAS